MSAIIEDAQELLQSLREEFPSLTIDCKEEAIGVQMLRNWIKIATKTSEGWVVNEEIKSTLPNYVLFKQLEAKLIAEDPSWYGAYLLVNNQDARFVYETFDSAWRSKDPSGFLGRIGIEYSSEDVASVMKESSSSKLCKY